MHLAGSRDSSRERRHGASGRGAQQRRRPPRARTLPAPPDRRRDRLVEMDDVLWAYGNWTLTSLAASATVGRCRGRPLRTAPTALSPPDRRRPHRTPLQPRRRHRRTTRRSAPTPRARPRRSSARDPCRTGTHAPPAAGAVVAAPVIGSPSRPSSPVAFGLPRPSAHLDSSTPRLDTRSSPRCAGGTPATDLRLPAAETPTRLQLHHGDRSWMTRIKYGDGRARP